MEWIVGLGVSWAFVVVFVLALCASAGHIDRELALDALIAADEPRDDPQRAIL
jgi:hypothetical protein